MDLATAIKQESLRYNLDSQLNFEFRELEALLAAHDDFIADGYTNILLSISQGAQPLSYAITKLTNLSAEADRLSAAIRGTYTKGDIIYVAEIIFQLKEFYDYMMNSYILFGISNTKGFETRENYYLYTIKQGETIQQIAEKLLGSRELATKIYETNIWLYNQEPKSLYYKEIKIPTKTPLKSAVTPNLGDSSWGNDLPNLLSATADGDLDTLTYRDTFVQDVLNIIDYNQHSVPEDPTIGNPLFSLIGTDLASLNPAVSARLLESAALCDPTIKSMKVTNLSYQQDAYTASIFVRPINSEETLAIEK